ncbi:MAG: [Fe-Fe] hydrogenase large subunit C-terminal domain-containing protein [Candidatus Berkelbacteria bacterium]
MTTYQESLEKLLESKEKTIALIAPSFPIDFAHPQIIGMLKKLGFDKVSEITFGARMTNYWHVEYIKTHPDQKYFITGPCPNCLALIKARYPELLQYVIPFASPVISQAKIIRKDFPDYKIVFFAPCQAKQLLEWPAHKDVLDLVLTFKELGEIFSLKGIEENQFYGQDFEFDSLSAENTKVYPISGGLAKTAMVHDLIPTEQVWIGDGPPNISKAFDEIRAGTSQYRFFDILNCGGGCIGGPGLSNTSLPIDEKIKLIKDYQQKMNSKAANSEENKPEIVTDIDFSVKL